MAPAELLLFKYPPSIDLELPKKALLGFCGPLHDNKADLSAPTQHKELQGSTKHYLGANQILHEKLLPDCPAADAILQLLAGRIDLVSSETKGKNCRRRVPIVSRTECDGASQEAQGWPH